MVLLIDVGNSHTEFGLGEDDRLLGSFRLSTDPRRTPDETGLLLLTYLQTKGVDPAALRACLIASVVPRVTNVLEQCVLHALGITPHIVDRNLDPGLKLGIESQEQLGADRSVACIEALARYGGPLLLLDFGTATTLDSLDAEGRYMGGCITAGPGITAQALSQHAALLPDIPLRSPGRVLHGTALGQMQAGLVLGYAGGIAALLRQARAELGAEAVTVVATGGFSALMAELLPEIRHVEKDLVLQGLLRLYRTRVAQSGPHPL